MPQPTDNEVAMLDQIDTLAAVMADALDAGDQERFLDALDESSFIDRRLAASRESTWGVWTQPLRNDEGDGMWDIYHKTELAHTQSEVA